MPNHKQAEKRDRQRERRRLRNRDALGAMRGAIRRARAAVDGGADNAQELIRSAISTVDRAIKKGALHRKTGARYISRLARRKPAA